MHQMSRRAFVALAAAAPAILARTTAAATITAEEIVGRIRRHVGVEWRSETVDTFKAGDPATMVTGIVTTAMATMDVLRRSVSAGANLVITHEPTFYAKGDAADSLPARGGGPGIAGRGGSSAGTGAGGGNASGQDRQAPAGAPAPAPDAVLAAKRDFIRQNNLVVWRFCDHWRLRRPDPLAQGLTDVLGWTGLRSADDPARVVIAETRLDALAFDIGAKLNARGGIRIVGAPDTPAQQIGLLPGPTALRASLSLLPTVDVIVAGEVREWEAVEYVRDAVTAGEKKGLILLGRIVSEDPGMNVCAQWLRTIVPELSTTWLPSGDPYWRPM